MQYRPAKFSSRRSSPGASAHTEGLRGPAKTSSMLGHNVLISDLWKVRNFWEWLAPGYATDNDKSNMAFVPYDRLSSYHDFLVQKADESTAKNVRVGLRARRGTCRRHVEAGVPGHNGGGANGGGTSHVESTSAQMRRL